MVNIKIYISSKTAANDFPNTYEIKLAYNLLLYFASIKPVKYVLIKSPHLILFLNIITCKAVVNIFVIVPVTSLGNFPIYI